MDDAQQIRNAIARWLQASKEGDLETLADILDDEMLFVVQSRPPFGKKEFLGSSSGKPYKLEPTIEVAEVVVNGDWALTRIHLSVDFAATEDVDRMRLVGPAMSVWRRSADGRWLIWRDANMVAPI